MQSTTVDFPKQDEKMKVKCKNTFKAKKKTKERQKKERNFT